MASGILPDVEGGFQPPGNNARINRRTLTIPHAAPFRWILSAGLGTPALRQAGCLTATFSGLPATEREDLFAGGSAPTPGGSFSITLPAFGVKAFRFVPATSTRNRSAMQAAQTSAPRRE